MTVLTKRYNEAFKMAARLHAKQFRKGTAIPYLSHLMAVSSLVLEQGGSEDEAIAALLHDAVEDQGGAPVLEEIRRTFGPVVAEIVEGCSDTDVVPKPPWRERKETYIAHVALASPSVRLVSAADKLHNARAILADYRALGDALWSRFNPGKDDILWYYTGLVAAFRQAEPGSSPIVEELARTVDELTALVNSSPRRG
ncbi:MAG: HD domain-containing protein [Chloroflexi bacterium]|nr:HD domain-containing protein [Chloroflexota bacterium]OJV99224.1 MAG: phosphohydrolase [Chloroflexi bacterium 54-19]